MYKEESDTLNVQISLNVLLVTFTAQSKVILLIPQQFANNCNFLFITEWHFMLLNGLSLHLMMQSKARQGPVIDYVINSHFLTKIFFSLLINGIKCSLAFVLVRTGTFLCRKDIYWKLDADGWDSFHVT